MWISTNGQERTLKDWSSLAEASWWILHRVFPLRSAWFSAIEFRPACSEIGKIAEPGQSKLVSDPWATIDVGSIDTEMRFLEPWEVLRYGNPYIRTEPAPGYPRTNLSLDKKKVRVHNARPVQSAFSLDGSGFEFVKDAAGGSTQMLAGICSSDKSQVETMYYEHVQSLVKQVTGADRVIIFDHTVRKQKSPEDEPNGTNVETPATIVHCNQSAGGALRRLRQNIGADESFEQVLQRRVQMLNVWRPLTDPVEDWPLAVMDTRTLSRSNIHATDLWRGEYELRGQTVSISHSTSQRWWYLGGHRPDEVTMIKIWDTDTSPATATRKSSLPTITLVALSLTRGCTSLCTQRFPQSNGPCGSSMPGKYRGAVYSDSRHVQVKAQAVSVRRAVDIWGWPASVPSGCTKCAALRSHQCVYVFLGSVYKYKCLLLETQHKQNLLWH